MVVWFGLCFHTTPHHTGAASGWTGFTTGWCSSTCGDGNSCGLRAAMRPIKALLGRGSGDELRGGEEAGAEGVESPRCMELEAPSVEEHDRGGEGNEGEVEG